MTEKTKRRLCAALAAGMMVTAVPARAAENPSTDRKSCASCSVPLPLTREATTYWWGVTAHELSASERDLAERIVMAEAGGESYECMLGVAQTIRERSEHWGMTVEEVLTARAQYAKPYKGEPSEDAKDAVSAVFDEGARAFAAYTTHFHDDSVDPWWNRSKEQRGEIDGMLFWGADVEMR